MKRIFFIISLIIFSNVLLAQKFTFLVKIGSEEFSFQNVSGLSSETQLIEYKTVNNTTYSELKMPGLKKYGTVTLKKGVAKRGFIVLSEMYENLKLNIINRATVTIKLMDQAGEPTTTWILAKAWVTKVQAKDKNNIESIEIAHEGLSILNGK